MYIGNKRGKEAAEESQRSKGQQQIANSLAHLDKKKAGGIENITSIRVGADWREAQRRVAEEKQRQERLQRLQEEAVRSGKQNAAVEMRWAELLDQNMPQELHNEIEAQKSACSEIIASKDTLIREFQLQLKSKDEAVHRDPAPEEASREAPVDLATLERLLFFNGQQPPSKPNTSKPPGLLTPRQL